MLKVIISVLHFLATSKVGMQYLVCPSTYFFPLGIIRMVGNMYKVTGKVLRTPMGGYGNKKAMTGPECMGCMQD